MYELFDLSSNNEPHNFRQMIGGGHTVGGWVKVGGGGETAPGSLYIHHDFPNWASRIRAAGGRVGGYWFAVPTRHDAERQADQFAHFLGKIQRRDLRPVLDFEKNLYGLSGGELETWAHRFSQRFKKVTGVGVLYYSYASYTRMEVPVGYGLWLADYTHANPPAPAPWKRWVAHQYTDKGRLPGHVGDIDLSRAPRLRPLLAHPIKGLI